MYAQQQVCAVYIVLSRLHDCRPGGAVLLQAVSLVENLETVKMLIIVSGASRIFG
jgi:hypothetical protein